MKRGANNDLQITFQINNSNFKLLTHIQKFKLCRNTPCINLETLKEFVHLKKLYFHSDLHTLQELDSKFGRNLEVLEYLKELKVVKLLKFSHYNYYLIQKRYPHVRFQWYHSPGGVSYYEGEFSADNVYHGKGIFICPKGDRYEGEFHGGAKEGKRIETFSSSPYAGDQYVGDFKNDSFSGQGIYTFSQGHRYEGEFKNNTRDGKGILTSSNGKRFEQEYQDGKLVKEVECGLNI
jgi:hypothetical protein